MVNLDRNIHGRRNSQSCGFVSRILWGEICYLIDSVGIGNQELLLFPAKGGYDMEEDV